MRRRRPATITALPPTLYTTRTEPWIVSPPTLLALQEQLTASLPVRDEGGGARRGGAPADEGRGEGAPQATLHTVRAEGSRCAADPPDRSKTRPRRVHQVLEETTHDGGASHAGALSRRGRSPDASSGAARADGRVDGRADGSLSAAQSRPGSTSLGTASEPQQRGGRSRPLSREQLRAVTPGLDSLVRRAEDRLRELAEAASPRRTATVSATPLPRSPPCLPVDPTPVCRRPHPHSTTDVQVTPDSLPLGGGPRAAAAARGGGASRVGAPPTEEPLASVRPSLVNDVASRHLL